MSSFESITQLFNEVNESIDEDIFVSKSESFLEEMGRPYNESMTRAELEEADELAETRELEAEEGDLQDFLNEQGPLDEEEAEDFLDDIGEGPEEFAEEVLEEIPEIEYGATEESPLMGEEEPRFGQLEETTYAPAEEAGTVGETAAEEAAETMAEETLEGFTEIAIETDSLIAETAGEIAGELTEMAVSSSFEIASAAIGEAAGAALVAVSSAAAVLGPVVALAGIGMAIYSAVDAMKKYDEIEGSKADYRNTVLMTYMNANKKSREAASFYNNVAGAESKYQDSMYKWVFGWKDPENYPEGRGFQIQQFKYKNEWNKYWTIQEKINEVAKLLGVSSRSLSKEDAFKNLAHDSDNATQLKAMYEEVGYAKQFRTYIDNQFVGNVTASSFDRAQIYKVNQLLMTRDGRLLEHYKRQAKNDPGYKAALSKLTGDINAKRLKEGNPQLTLSQVEFGDARGFKSGTGYIKAKGTKSSIPFWALYYKTNKSTFRKQDASHMNERYKQWVARGKTAIKHKVTQEEIDYQNSFFIHDQKKIIHGRDMGEHPNDFNNVMIDTDGLGLGQEEKTFFRKKRQKRRRPPREPPKDEEDDKQKPTSGDTEVNTGTEYIDTTADNKPSQENDFDKNYFFSIETAEHLCRLCARAYDPPEENETEEGFDVVEFMGTEGLLSETQGRMYYSQSSKVIIIVYRGTDFSRLASTRPDLAMEDIVIDFEVEPVLDEVTNVKCHAGFHQYFKDSYEQVKAFVQKYHTDDCIIYTTGHSLGAPPSILCSMYLNNLLEDRVCVNYSFGCPRGFTKDTSDRVNELASPCYRIADTWDFIAGMPPNILGYFHVGECHAIDSQYFGVSAKMMLVSDKQKANDLFNYPIVNWTFHLMKHYMQSMKFLLTHHNLVGNSFRTESQMIDSGHISHTSSVQSNPNASSTILLTGNHSYRHTGRHFGNKRVYHQADAQHLEFLPSYHQGHGLTMTPIPSDLRRAIVGVYMYREGEFSGRGQVKGLVVY